MSDIKKQIDELIEIAKAATPGPWHDQSWQEDRFYSKQELADCKFSAAFDPTVAIKLLESWKYMRETLVDISTNSPQTQMCNPPRDYAKSTAEYAVKSLDRVLE
jgi:hypothetical protein